MTKGRKRNTRAGGKPSERASISFPPEMYRTLEEIADRKKVSLAWVVREAVEKYIADMWPLFAKQEH
jgi:predicted DNA-binding protein